MPFVATLSSDSVSVREDRASMFWQGFANKLFVIRRSRSLPCHLDLISRTCHVARLSSDSVPEETKQACPIRLVNIIIGISRSRSLPCTQNWHSHCQWAIRTSLCVRPLNYEWSHPLWMPGRHERLRIWSRGLVSQGFAGWKSAWAPNVKLVQTKKLFPEPLEQQR